MFPGAVISIALWANAGRANDEARTGALAVSPGVSPQSQAERTVGAMRARTPKNAALSAARIRLKEVGFEVWAVSLRRRWANSTRTTGIISGATPPPEWP